MSLRERSGGALLACLFALLLLTLLGGLALEGARVEMRASFYVQQEAAALHLAEAGIHLVTQWMSHSPSAPSELRLQISPQFRNEDGGDSFFGPDGSSQFSGSTSAPDLYWFPHHDPKSLDPSLHEILEALGENGRIFSIKVYAPQWPGAVATVESTGETRAGVQKTVAADLVGQGSLPGVLPLKGSWHEMY